MMSEITVLCIAIGLQVTRLVCIAVLMIMASHQTFSGQFWQLTDQIQAHLPHIINGESMYYNRIRNVRTNFNPYHKHYIVRCVWLYGSQLCE